MKKSITLACMCVLMITSSCSKFDDSQIWESLKKHEERIALLETLCNKLNTNVSSLQSIVAALQNNDYVTNVSPIMEGNNNIGYTVSFAKKGSITIYHGKNGLSPVVGIKQDKDGIYYWTINGEWLLNESNNKIKANGTDGLNGLNGKDGVTPKFKIEEDYWFISYNNGRNWEKLGKAIGNNGQDGASGVWDDNIFSEVTQDEKYVYFHLSDGNIITLTKHDPLNIQFEDLTVKAICCRQWDTNKDGELSYAEAAEVTSLAGFQGNTNIVAFTELQYFPGITELGGFEGCESLWKITLPENIIKINPSAFEKCSSLTSNIVIPDKVTSIGYYAFTDCSNLESVNIPGRSNDLEVGPQNAFLRCSGKLNINCNIPDYYFMDNSFTEIFIGDNATKIGEEAFNGSDNCVITLGENINDIGSGAFKNCDNLILYIKATTPPTIPFRGLFLSSEYITIYVPSSSVQNYKTGAWQQYVDYIKPYNFN